LQGASPWPGRGAAATFGSRPGALALIRLHALTVAVPGRTLVRGLDLELAAGERAVLMGPNGSGKSTLLSVIAGLEEPAEGLVERPAEPPGMLFQDGALWPHLSVAEHLAFVDRHRDEAWRARLLERFELGPLAARRPESLSGGERVRLALARTFASRPRWVLLDEPFTHLDPAVADLVRRAVPALIDELGATSVTVLHDAGEAALFGETLVLLDGEGGAHTGSTLGWLARPPSARLARLLQRGTSLSARAGADGRAVLLEALLDTEAAPGTRVEAWLPARAVGWEADASPEAPATLLAPDAHGGCWIRYGDHVLASARPPDGHAPGSGVRLSVDARALVVDELGP